MANLRKIVFCGMIKILFVCLGNICRSPLAEGIFTQQIEEQGLAHLFTADSAGTASYHIGNLADKRSISVAAQHHIKLTHRARAFVANDFQAFDYVVAMDKNNLYDIKKMMPLEAKTNVFLMRSFDHLAPDGNVPDPYYGELKDFEEVYDILARSCAKFIKHLQSAHAIR